MKYLMIIFNVFCDVTKSSSLFRGFIISIILFIGLLSLLITAVQVFIPFTYIAF